jgi:transposase
MRKTKEILRMHLLLKKSQRKISESCKASKGTICEVIRRSKECGIVAWEEIEKMDEDELSDTLFPKKPPKSELVMPDWPALHDEMRRAKHVTEELLWSEYRAKYGEATYSYSHFAALYRSWRGKLDLVMRQNHRAGEKVFVDFAGDTLNYFDAASGGSRKAHIFVAVLGASAYTFAMALPNETRSSWIDGHIRALEFFEGVPEIAVPDNPKALVRRADNTDPDINPLYSALAEHYGFAIIPARVRKPRDKARVENGVLLVERWIMAVLRKREFRSLDEINLAIRECLIRLNAKPFKKRPGTRMSIFTTIEKPCLRPLPAERFEIEDWSIVMVGNDYHVNLSDGSSYSVPCHFAKRAVDVCLRRHFVEILLKGKRIAFHERMPAGERSTKREHMPVSHQAYAAMNKEDIERSASEISVVTKEYVTAIMTRAQCLQKGIQTASGILHIAEKVPRQTFIDSCAKALSLKAYTKSDFLRIAAMLGDEEKEKTSSDRAAEKVGDRWHENIRGPAAYRCPDESGHDGFFESDLPSSIAPDRTQL